MSRPLLEAADVVAGYEHPVSRPVCFSVAAGETVALTGPNGCGKTTLLRAILGDARLHAGRLWRQPGLRLAYLPQQRQLPPDLPLTAADYLACAGAPVGGLPMVYGQKLAERFVGLSGGTRQFLAIWACLHGGADLVLLDEPGNNLDRTAAENLARVLLAAHPAILLVSHEPELVGAIGARVVTMTP